MLVGAEMMCVCCFETTSKVVWKHSNDNEEKLYQTKKYWGAGVQVYDGDNEYKIMFWIL